MSSSLPLPLLRLKYYDAAQAYLRSLPPEHFMEAVPQAKQREITVASFALVHAQRPDVQYFNELLIQYPTDDNGIGQVVPDNMVVVHPEPIEAEGSYDLPFQPVGPLFVLEYFSKSNRRKDYEESFEKYERHVRVPYYLLFVPDVQELTLYKRRGKKFVSVKPNARGRQAIPELEMEVGLLDGWARFWFREELLPLPADLQRELDETRRLLAEERRRADKEQARRQELEAEVARLREELESSRRNRK